MRKLIVLAIAAFLAIGAALLPSRSHALPLSSAAADIRLTTESLNLVEKTQWVWGGRRYCFYPTGWHGPGWYWCGYAWRRGFGWGGVYGWRGWRHPRYHARFYRGRVVHPRRHVDRPRAGRRGGVNRPRAGRGGNRPQAGRGGNRPQADRGGNRPQAGRGGGGGGGNRR